MEDHNVIKHGQNLNHGHINYKKNLIYFDYILKFMIKSILLFFVFVLLYFYKSKYYIIYIIRNFFFIIIKKIIKAI